MKFQCQESCGGRCCTAKWDGVATYVFLTKHDRIKLSAFLQRPVKAFASYGEFRFTRFTDKVSKQWFLKTDKGTCPFLKFGKCSVYEARPTQCKTFPFWPELMVKKTYLALKEYCPGVDKGSEVTHHLLNEQVKADEELREESCPTK